MASSSFVPPKVIFSSEALKHLFHEALLHPGDETGWGHCGLIFADGSIVVTNTLLPLDGDVNRQIAKVSVGGTEMGEAVKWLMYNSVLTTKLQPDVEAGELTLVGKGHSHHVLNYKQHSGTDRQSVIALVRDEGMKAVVSPLVLIDELPKTQTQVTGQGSISVEQRSKITVMFYYYSKAMLDQGIKEPVLVTPEVVEVNHVPITPPLGWRFTQGEDCQEQLRQLKNYGTQVMVHYKDITAGPPMEIIFTVTKPNWAAILQIVTPWNFPEGQPEFRLLPVNGREASEVSDYNGTPELLNGDVWKPGEDFIEAVFRLEARGQL